MQPTYLDRFLRFGLGLLATAVALAYLVWVWPGGSPDLSLSIRNQRPVAELVGEALPGTLGNLGMGLVYAAPLALLLGIPAGLRPGSRLDRLLQAPAVILMGLPAFTVSLIVLLRLFQWREVFSLSRSVSLTLALLLAGWLARAIRNGLASARVDGGALKRGRALVAVAGQILQQTGSVLVVTGLAETVAPGNGLWRLLTTATMTRDLPVFRGALWVLLLCALVGHLVGDLLVTAAGGSTPPSTRISPSWLIVGGLLVAVLPLTAFLGLGGDTLSIDLTMRLKPPGRELLLGTDLYGRDLLARLGSGARVSLLIATAASTLATVGGLLLAGIGKAAGRWGMAVLAPRVAVPSFLGPLAVGLIGTLVYGPHLLTLILALGYASSPTMAQAFRTLLDPSPGSPPGQRWAGAAGGLVLTFAQILMVESILSYTGIGVQPPTASLGNIVFESLAYLRTSPHLFAGAVPGLVGLAGLFLVGYALREQSAE